MNWIHKYNIQENNNMHVVYRWCIFIETTKVEYWCKYSAIQFLLSTFFWKNSRKYAKNSNAASFAIKYLTLRFNWLWWKIYSFLAIFQHFHPNFWWWKCNFCSKWRFPVFRDEIRHKNSQTYWNIRSLICEKK